MSPSFAQKFLLNLFTVKHKIPRISKKAKCKELTTSHLHITPLPLNLNYAHFCFLHFYIKGFLPVLVHIRHTCSTGHFNWFLSQLANDLLPGLQVVLSFITSGIYSMSPSHHSLQLPTLFKKCNLQTFLSPFHALFCFRLFISIWWNVFLINYCVSP